ncbi:MAG TPA: TetR/AcrR family transcriptional regulator [Solirubrobacteraceae bacterium]|nr:TetR/AcrR family transcriptional regulator [Solirubrobacteraceae bacterium]
MPGSPAASRPVSVRERILASALDQIGDFGVRRFTVDELARRVGLSRVTIYRHFPSRGEVVGAALLYELRGFLTEIEERVATIENPEARLTEAFVQVIVGLRRHAMLQRLVRTEPELLLPLLTTEGGPVLAIGREFLVGLVHGPGGLPPEAAPDPELAALAEVTARLVTSFTLTRDSVIPLGDETQLRRFAVRYVGALAREYAAARAAR